MLHNLIVAVLHRMGPNVRFEHSNELHEIFAEAFPKEVILHRLYGTSKDFDEAMLILAIGGSIESVTSAGWTKYQATAGVLGDGGKSIYKGLTRKQKIAVNKLAKKIKDGSKLED